MPQFLKRCEYWIFDLDGTLTQPVHDFAYIRKELDIPPDEDILLHLASLPEVLRDQKSERLDQLEHFYALQTKSAVGVYPLIKLLARKQCRLGIVTRNTKVFAQLSLSVLQLSSHFADEAIIGRDEAPPKPEPHGIQTLIAQWGASAEDVMMVGDYKYDLLAGRAAGCRTVHVSDNDELQWPSLTDYRFNSLSELSELLEHCF